MEFIARPLRFPCGICKLNCTVDCLKCGHCNTWFHCKCENVSRGQLKAWTGSDLDYICKGGRSIAGGQFNYDKGMSRLEKAIRSKDINRLRAAAAREELFGNVCAEIPEEDRRVIQLTTDHDAAEILRSVDGITGTPIVTTCDNNSLFNAVSLHMLGNETLSTHLRYLTCVHVVTSLYNYLKHPLRKTIQRLSYSPSIESACMNAGSGGPSNIWTVVALTDVIRRPMRILYPYGEEDSIHREINMAIHPQINRALDQPVLHVLWNHTAQATHYSVNYFIAVVDVQETTCTNEPTSEIPQRVSPATTRWEKRARAKRTIQPTKVGKRAKTHRKPITTKAVRETLSASIVESPTAIDMEYLACQDFLIGDVRVGSERHLLFSTAEQQRVLRQTKRWFMDGTFKVVNAPFRGGQLMSIHGFVLRDGVQKQIPLAFILMSRRRAEDYKAVLRKVVAVIGEVTVEGVVLDFEAGAWLAVREVFPWTQIKGCVFHWTQAVWRHVQELGLKPAYTERSNIYTYIRQLLALPFLPSNHIRDAFHELGKRANTDPLRALVQYIEKTWMNNSIFDVASWSIYGNTIRTNNDTEGWHRRLNSRAGHAGLTFYRLVPVLRKEAEVAHTQMRLVAENAVGRVTRPTYRNMEHKIQGIWEKYEAGEITTANLLRSCSRVYGPMD